MPFLIFLFFLLTTITSSTNVDLVSSWSKNFSDFFSEELKQMRVNEIQDSFDSTPRSTTIVDGTVEIASYAARVEGYMKRNEKELDSFSSLIMQERKSSTSLLDPSSLPSLFRTSNNESDSLYRYFAHASNGKIEMETNQYTQKHHSADTTNSIHVMDARFTPWYANAVAGPKHIFIIIDSRFDTNTDPDETNRKFFLSRLIQATTSILSTISSFDTLHIRTVTKRGTLSEPLLSCNNGNGNLVTNKKEIIHFINHNLTTIDLERRNNNINDDEEEEKRIWSLLLRNTFLSVDKVFSSVNSKNQVSALLILSALKPEGAGYLESSKNKNELPIFTFMFPRVRSTYGYTSTSSNSWCSNLGVEQKIYTLKQASQVGLYYESIANIMDHGHTEKKVGASTNTNTGEKFRNVSLTNSTTTSSTTSVPASVSDSSGYASIQVMFWGGIIKSLQPLIYTFARPIFEHVTFEGITTTETKSILLGVACIDVSLRKFKQLFDKIDRAMGRVSFPCLVTSQGTTIYHPLLSLYKKNELQDVGLDINQYEWYDGFEEHIRQPLLDGVAGSSKTIAIIRALPDGDISSPFQQTSRIDTKYYYQAVSGYELRLLFAYEVVELERVTLLPRDPPAAILSDIESYDNNLNNDITSQIPDFHIYNNENCKLTPTSLAFTNCKPDRYCELNKLDQLLPDMMPNQPECVENSICECEPHRWELGTLCTSPSVSAPTLLIRANNDNTDIQIPTSTISAELSGQIMNFLLRTANSENPNQISNSVSAMVCVGLRSTTLWRQDMYGVNNETSHLDSLYHHDVLTIYFSDILSSTIMLPGNMWSPLFDGTRRPWFQRTVGLLERRQVTPYAVMSSPYKFLGKDMYVVTLSTVIWNKDTQPDNLKRKHQIMGTLKKRKVEISVFWSTFTVIVVIIVVIFFYNTFLFYCLLYMHSFKTNPNSVVTNFLFFSFLLLHCSCVAF